MTPMISIQIMTKADVGFIANSNQSLGQCCFKNSYNDEDLTQPELH